MNSFFEWVFTSSATVTKYGAGGFIAASAYLLGGMDKLLITLLLFMLFDYISGVMASAFEGSVNSQRGYKGIIKKFGILFIVAMAHLLDELALNDVIGVLLPLESPARTLVILFYLGMEGISNLENWGRMNLPLPSFLKQAFEVLKQKGDSK